MRAWERKRLTSLGFFPPLSFLATLALKFCQNSEEEGEHIPIVIKRRTKLLLPGNQIHTCDGWAAGIRIPGVAERFGNWRRVQTDSGIGGARIPSLYITCFLGTLRSWGAFFAAMLVQRLEQNWYTLRLGRFLQTRHVETVFEDISK